MANVRTRYRDFFTACLFSVAALLAATRVEAQENRQNIVVHLSHYADDLHSASMALSLATNLSSGGAAVTLFLDLEGVRLADSRVPQELRWGTSAAIADLYGGFLTGGGSVLLCAHCAHAAGIETSDLRKGSRIGSDTEVRELFLAADKVIDF